MASQEYLTLNSKIEALTKRVMALETADARLETVNEADARELAIRSDLQEMANEIAALQRKLAKINLPEEARFYLTEQKVNYLSSLAASLTALKAEIEQAMAIVLSKIQYLDTIG